MENRNHTISVIRVIGMVMIICCHLFSWLGISALSQLFNVGIFVFLLISGWLYSNRSIDKPLIWLERRWEKLCIPIIIWMILVSAYSVIVRHEYPSAAEVIILTLNLQGIAWIFTMLPKMGSYGTALVGLSHLWFVTVIFICYVLVVAVKNNESYIRRHKHVIRYCTLFAFVFAAFLGINLIYFICFFMGYAIGQGNIKLTKRRVVYSTLIMICSLAVRLISKKYFDGTALYDTIVVGISHTILALWIFLIVSYVGNTSNLVNVLSKSKIISYLDVNSYYIYITHYFFLSTTFGLKKFSAPLPCQLLLFCVMSFITALVLKQILKPTNALINKVLYTGA